MASGRPRGRPAVAGWRPIYGAIAGTRMARAGQAAGIPVVCIGNLTLGGAGKTPTAIAVAQLLAAAGRKPFVLSRGYGGTLPGPVRVDPASHRAIEVGDEPLLLARVAPTIVARDRVAGAQAARAAGADVIVMDDGFQNPSLAKDLSIVVVDGRRGIGNGAVCPAGPLRAPLDAPASPCPRRAADRNRRAGARRSPPPRERAACRCSMAGWCPIRRRWRRSRRRPVLAFAGIGDPEKFFATLGEAGIDVRARLAVRRSSSLPPRPRRST